MGSNQRTIAVVFVAYGCVPTSRVDDHFAWNKPMYRDPLTRVYMVTATMHDLPTSVMQCIFPSALLPILNGERVFSLSKTKNFGIQCALNDGADVIISTDVDIAFSPAAWEIMCEVEHGQAIAPVYHRCQNFANRHNEKPRPPDYGMTGTTAMVAAHWRQVQYDETYKAYGGEDGRLLNDIRKVRPKIQLTPPTRKFPIAPVVWHVDHTLATVDNVPGAGRPDCWGRAEGFNPDNFEANRKLHTRR